MLAHMLGLLRLMVPWAGSGGEGCGGHGGSCLSPAQPTWRRISIGGSRGAQAMLN